MHSTGKSQCQCSQYKLISCTIVFSRRLLLFKACLRYLVIIHRAYDSLHFGYHLVIIKNPECHRLTPNLSD